jgi:3-isopropylmalate/(R)-2-methylmalate dehydratase large subunit
MGWAPGQKIVGTPIDVAFIGSCTNGRLSDFLAVAELIDGGNLRVAPHVKAIIVPGSQRVRDELVARGLDKVFVAAGFEFREAGCSMCLAMNPDRLQGRQVCASSSNRNLQGPSGFAERPHAAHVAGHGGRLCLCRRGDRPARTSAREALRRTS